MANIGDLYDARTDRFTGQSVVTGSTEPLAVNSTPMESSREEFLVDATFYDRLALLVNDKELQLSVVLGLVVPEANISALIGQDDNNISPMNGVLLRTVLTLREQVGSVTDIKHLVSSHDGTISEGATHVVVGIEWGATVVVCLDQCGTGNPSEQHVSENLQQQLQILMSTLKSGTRPNSQVLSDINSTYAISCVSNGLSQDNQPYRASLENAIAILSDLPRLAHSVNDGKGTPQSFILMPLSLLTERSAIVPNGVEESILNQTLALFHDVQLAKHNFVDLSQYLNGRKNYLQDQEIGKIDEFFAGFQQAEKSLYDDVTTTVVAVRSGHVDQSRLADIHRAFSHGCYSHESLRAFFGSIEPMLQKTEFLDKLIREGIVIIGSSLTELSDITRNANVYILYATEDAKRQHPRVWEDNSCAFLDTVRQEKRKQRGKSDNSSVTTFAYIDCDIVRGANVDEQIAIYRYNHGKIVSRNVAEERAITASMNIAESSQKKQSFIARPMRRAVVEIPCPGASLRCSSSQRTWSCEVCKEQMEYGFDDNFYCSCGKAPVNAFSYRCNESQHGDDFHAFQPHVAKELVKNMKPFRELNILFLGETGVGKSTFINGFANYISYSTLSEAENSDNVCVIPTKFTMMNENYKEIEIKTGTADKNEDQQVGRSSTQMPKSYVFRRGKILVRIIDTPGIGDTRGIDHDRVNFQNIMTHLSNLDEINGICILLKPNNARLTVMFTFCIKELLTHLHRDACKNIVFCFTNSRGTFYKPGDTLPALRELILNSTDVDLQLRRETIYCIDNESVRFLAALNQGVKFSEDEKKNYSTSWEMSVKETERLVDYISSLPPHKVKNTLSLNDARRLIVALSRPLAEITSTIQNNIGVVEQRRQEVMESTKHKEDLNTKLYIPVIDLQTKPLNYPRTVCTAQKCVKHISVGGVQKIDYMHHCHPHCNLTGVQTNIVNCVALQQCAAMNQFHSCKHCGCSWSVHMHITYECTQVQTQIVDEAVERQIKDKATKIETTQQHLQSLQDRINKLEDEKRLVAEVSAQFGCFLKHNAIAPFNDAMSDYLEHLIQVERGKISAGGDRNNLAGLEKMKSMYEEEVKMLEKAINDPTSYINVPSAEKIKKLYDDLCRLEITGPMLKDVMNVAEAAGIGATQYSERRIQAYRKPPPYSYRMAVSQSPRGWAKVGHYVGRFLGFRPNWRP